MTRSLCSCKPKKKRNVLIAHDQKRNSLTPTVAHLRGQSSSNDILYMRQLQKRCEPMRWHNRGQVKLRLVRHSDDKMVRAEPDDWSLMTPHPTPDGRTQGTVLCRLALLTISATSLGISFDIYFSFYENADVAPIQATELGFIQMWHSMDNEHPVWKTSASGHAKCRSSRLGGGYRMVLSKCTGKRGRGACSASLGYSLLKKRYITSGHTETICFWSVMDFCRKWINAKNIVNRETYVGACALR